MSPHSSLLPIAAAGMALGFAFTLSPLTIVVAQAFALARSWRLRNVLLGIPQLKYDYMIAFEGYGRSSYLWVMTFLQVLVGPAPYVLRVLNAALFLGAV